MPLLKRDLAGGLPYNVAGIIDYFSQSGAFSGSQYAKESDGSVLWVIQEGLAARWTGRPAPGGDAREAVTAWAAFFTKQQPDPDLPAEPTDVLKPLLERAESAGVRYADRAARGAVSSTREALVVAASVVLGDVYRDTVVGGGTIATWGGAPDPRRDRHQVQVRAHFIEQATLISTMSVS